MQTEDLVLVCWIFFSRAIPNRFSCSQNTYVLNIFLAWVHPFPSHDWVCMCVHIFFLIVIARETRHWNEVVFANGKRDREGRLEKVREKRKRVSPSWIREQELEHTCSDAAVMGRERPFTFAFNLVTGKRKCVYVMFRLTPLLLLQNHLISYCYKSSSLKQTSCCWGRQFSWNRLITKISLSKYIAMDDLLMENIP